MAIRFTKRIKIAPGVRINLGLGGISTTFGARGASVNIGKRGTHLNAGIPGSGLSVRKKIGGGKAAPAPTKAAISKDTASTPIAAFVASDTPEQKVLPQRRSQLATVYWLGTIAVTAATWFATTSGSPSLWIFLITNLLLFNGVMAVVWVLRGLIRILN